MPYSVTVKIAAPGNVYKGENGTEHTSRPGHMWYSISANNITGDADDKSYGFAPIKSGAIAGPGRVTHDDQVYKGTYYQRTIEISKAQYDKLRAFGDAAVGTENIKPSSSFNLYYKDVRNNCVDFTWAALNDAGLHTEKQVAKGGRYVDKKYEGSLKPTENVDDIKRIPAPFPKSILNEERETPMSKNRDFLQKLLSEDQPKDAQMKFVAKLDDAKSNRPVDVVIARIADNLGKNPEFLSRIETKQEDVDAVNIEAGHKFA